MKTSLRLLLLGCLMQPLASYAQSYCTPEFGGAGSGFAYITGFVFENITNTGTGLTGAPGYVNYQGGGPSTITSVAPGGSYTATITFGSDPDLDFYSVWVDLDQDFTYEVNELLASGQAPPIIPFSSIATSITLPADARRGYTGLRVMVSEFSVPEDPCGTYTYGETEDYTLIISDGAPCIPMYTYGTSGGDYIDGFQFNTINNVGSGSPNGWPYSDYRYGGPNHKTAVAPGGTYTATITSGPDGLADIYTIWVDLDHDLTYEPNELLVQASASDGGVQTTLVDVTIPADAPRGYTGMRVMCAHDEFPTDPCGTYELGETEDYTVVIDDGAPCIPVYGFGTFFGDYIDGFAFGTINNSGSGAEGGAAYRDYRHSGPGFITSAAPGGTYTATITSGPSGSFDEYSIWVDLDGDLNFEPNELLAQATILDQGVQTTALDVTIPANARTGYTTMRVMVADGSTPDDACGTYFNGETEDYTIVIDDGSPCIPVFGYQASEGDYVSAVQLEGLNWNVATTPPLSGYDDATASGAHLQAEVTSQLTVTKGTFGGGNFVSVWIDWSNNGFDALDLLGTQVVSGSGGTATFDITPNVTARYVRMRVACSYAELADACGTADYGHAMDFTLAIGHVGWPCLPLLGYGTQLGDGFADLSVQGVAHAAQTNFPYYAWSASTPYHWEQAGSYGVSFETGAYAPETYRVCMDMNDDGDFSDVDEVLATSSSASAGQLMAISFTIPANCPPGQHFMRLRANDDANYPLIDQCDDKLYGQIVDWVVAVADPNGPCMPFSENWTTFGDFIDGVQLGGAQNLGTGSAYGPAYHDYPSPAISLIAGSTDTLTITSGDQSGDMYAAWIDYNNDQDFDDANEFLGNMYINGTGQIIFTVPIGTPPGEKRLRVRCAFALGADDACGDELIGETEDYRVYIELSTGVLAATIADLRVRHTTDGVQLLTDAALIGNSYLLLDATGRTLSAGRITADRTDLPMLSFARGAYTVQVLHGDARQVKRFVW